MKQNLPKHILEAMSQGLSNSEAISEGLIDPLDLPTDDSWLGDDDDDDDDDYDDEPSTLNEDEIVF